MKQIKTLTLTEFENRLRGLGITMSRQKSKMLIKQGLFQGICFSISQEREEYLILEKEFEEWVEAHAVEVEMSDEVLAFLQANELCVGGKEGRPNEPGSQNTPKH